MTDNNARELELLTLREITRNESGRTFIWRCLQNSLAFANIFDKEAIVHAHSAGKREHGLWLLEELKEAAPENYIQMMREHLND